MAESATIQTDRTSTLDGAWISYEDFLVTDWPNPHVEWVDGKVVDMAPIGGEHSEEHSWLDALFRHYVETNQCGAIRLDPFQMRTGPDLPGRAPDIIFVSNDSINRLHETYLDGPADVAVEIVSPGSGGTDRGDKYFEYERGGVKEYWLIDPQRSQAE